MHSPFLHLLSQTSPILWLCRTSCHSFGFLSHFFDLVSIPPIWGNDRTSAVLITYFSSTSPSSQTGGCHHNLTIAVIAVLSAVKQNTSTISNLIIISQLNHFTFVSALLLPVLRLNLTLPLRLQGLGTGGWLDLTRQNFPAIYNQLTKANRVSSAR